MVPAEETSLLAHDAFHAFKALEFRKESSCSTSQIEKRPFTTTKDAIATSRKDRYHQKGSILWLLSTTKRICIVITLITFALLFTHTLRYSRMKFEGLVPTGSYRLVEVHEGSKFFDFYEFFDGPDSIGSAGYVTYVSQNKAVDLNITKIVTEHDTGEDFIYLSSSSSEDGPRNSFRLEGKRRFERGLFILDVRHIPNGCGVWPAFWLTDEANWPKNGEIDILEGVNGKTTAKTALHTSNECDMYAHVAPWQMTGNWEWVTGIPDTFTGQPNFDIAKPADNCWVMAQHQWENEGCTAVHNRNDTIGGPVNEAGGGVYVLEWDPQNLYIKSWVFSPLEDMPMNLKEVIDTASSVDSNLRVTPDPFSWGLPYAYFAIGENTGCSADHFKNMRIVFNLAFCGAVSGNRFFAECPAEASIFNVTNDPVKTCNAYVQSSPDALMEAYWKIKGVYVYEREFENKKFNTAPMHT